MKLVVKRREIKDLAEGWILLYGRRKVGKSYLLKNFFQHDEYYDVLNDGSIWAKGAPLERISDPDTLIQLISSSLQGGKRVVLDEFQRLPLWVLERIKKVHPKGTLVLSGSSMGVVERVLNPSSPLPGFFREVHLGLIHPQDILRSIPSVDYAAYLRDPWLIPLMEGKDILRDLYGMLSWARYTVPSLIGEIFLEEDRKLTETYRGLVKLIGEGVGSPPEMATRLYGMGVIRRDSTSQIAPYLSNLERMGVIKRIPIYKKRGFIFRMISPIFSVYYYIDAKYGLERERPPYEVVKENLRKAHSFSIEDFCVLSLAERLGGEVRYSHTPEIDGIVVDRRERPIATVEVKWGKLRKKDISTFLDKCGEIGGRKIIVARSGYKDHDEATILMPDDFRRFIIKE